MPRTMGVKSTGGRDFSGLPAGIQPSVDQRCRRESDETETAHWNTVPVQGMVIGDRSYQQHRDGIAFPAGGPYAGIFCPMAQFNQHPA